MAHLLIGLDLGSSSAKAVVLGGARARAAPPVARRGIGTRRPGPGRVEHDAAEIFEAGVGVLQDALRRSGAGRDGAAIPLGIATQRSTILFWDRDTGRPLTPAYSWQDRRGAVLCDRLLRSRPSATHRTGSVDPPQAREVARLVAERTGLRLGPHYSASKISWALRNVPGLRQRVASGRALWGTLGTYLIWRLSEGALYAVDHASAQRTSLMDIGGIAWDPDLFSWFGLETLLDAPALPALIPTFPTGEADLRMGSWRLRLRGMTGDQQAAMLWLGGLREDRIALNYGSGAFVLRGHGAERAHARGLLTTLVASWANGDARAARAPGGRSGQPPGCATRFAVEGTVNAAGVAIDWVLRRLGLHLRTTDLDRFLGREPEGPRSVHFLPAVGGLGAPNWDPRARPAFFGQFRGADARTLVRATIESIAQRCAEIVPLADDSGGRGRAPSRSGRTRVVRPTLLASGGLTACRTLLQAQADLLQRPILVHTTSDATALGAARMAAGGPQQLFEALAGRPGGQTIHPRISGDEAVERRRAWRRAVYG
jgi:glycerol kinase